MTLRISGLASGMNIDDIVSQLMTAERMPLDKLTQKKTYTEWQRDDYRTMNTAMSELDTLIFEGVGKQASFIKKTVTTSNDDILTVKNASSTSDFSGTVDKVTQLATSATMISTGETVASDSKKTLGEIFTTGVTFEPLTIKAINKDGNLEDYSLEISSTDTLESVISKINKDSNVNVFFDEKSKKFSIAAKYTGSAEAEATIQLTGSLFTDGMKMSTNSNDVANTTAGGSAGQNAILTYNGLEIERTSNTFIINGASITVKETTDKAVTFSSTPDVDSIFDTIKKFVDSYNGLIENISSKTAEKKNKDYAPLSDEQKKELSEDEVKRWEDLARKGTLNRDSTLSSLLTKMRSSMYSSVEGTSFNNLAKIGIATTSNYLEGGKLEIDEEKLRAAIAEDPNGIYELFMGGGDASATNEQGIARRLRADLKTAMTNISEKAGKTSSVNNTFSLGRLLDNYEDKISDFEERMKALETRYYKQFTAMETAINKANSQSASLASFFTS